MNNVMINDVSNTINRHIQKLVFDGTDGLRPMLVVLNFEANLRLAKLTKVTLIKSVSKGDYTFKSIEQCKAV